MDWDVPVTGLPELRTRGRAGQSDYLQSVHPFVDKLDVSGALDGGTVVERNFGARNTLANFLKL